MSRTDSPQTGITRSLADRAVEKGIVLLLIFTPLAFGTVQHWSVAVMELLAFSLLFLELAKNINSREALDSEVPPTIRRAGKPENDIYGARESEEIKSGNSKQVSGDGNSAAAQKNSLSSPDSIGGSREKGPVRASVFLFFSFLLLVLFQLLPLPEGLLRVISPLSLATYKKFGYLAGDSLLPVSTIPYVTVQELLKLLSYAAVFYVIISHYRTRVQLHSLVKTILYIGISLALFAVIQKVTWNGRIFWFYPVEEYLRSGAGIWGPYINRNHFAGYMEMVIPLALGLLIYSAPDANTLPGVPFVRRLARFMASENLVRFSLIFLSVLVMSACLFMTLSRGGIAGFGISFLFFVWITQKRRTLKNRALLLGLLAVVIAVVIVFAAWDQLENRFEALEKESQISRLIVWQDSLNILKDYVFFGSGLGTFENTFMRYQTRYPLALFDHAHNDYVELLTDTGLTGFTIIVSLALVFFFSVYRKWLRKRGLFAKCIGAGGLSSCIAMAVHSFTDFNLHIPANALLLTVIAALTYAAVFNVREKKEEQVYQHSGNNAPAFGTPSYLKRGKGELFSAGYFFRLMLVALLFLALLSFPARVLIADHYYGRVSGLLDDPATEGLDVKPLLPETLPDFLAAIRSLETAHSFSPSRALYPKALSELYSRLGRWAEAMELLGAPLPPNAVPKHLAFEKTFYYLQRAITLEPANADFHLALGHHYDTVLKDTPSAEDEYQKAVAAFPVSVGVRNAVATRYLQTGRKGDALEQARMIAALDESYILEDLPQKADIIQRRPHWYVQRLYSSYLFRALDIAWSVTPDPKVVSGITPNTPEAQEVLKAFMEWKGIEEKE
ncbi:MAG: hypothetical protein C0402_13315 [Thermodesulfovibrio sp.]|nr:hypothetical protein [Thermodesulfovibrio sp.]